MHDKEEIPWNVSFLDSATRGRRGQKEADDGGQGMSIDYDPYQVINEYWKFLPKDKQGRIFDVYRRIKEAFNTAETLAHLNLALVHLVAELVSHHDMNDVMYWVDFKSQYSKTPVRMPVKDPNLLAEHDATTSSKKPREGTYTLSDYHALVVMSLAIRSMIPVWGDYIEMVKDPVGTSLKEYEAYHLLRVSNMYHSGPMEKLREYVRFLTRPDIPKPSATYAGISSEEFPEWMLGLVVVRKLGCLDISGNDTTVSNMKTLFNYIGHKLKNHENSFRGTISEKIFEGTKVEGENNLSTLEGYRNPLDISTGDTERYPIYMKGGGGETLEDGNVTPLWGQPIEKARRICPDIPESLVDKMIEVVYKSHPGVPEKGQIQLIQIVLNVNKTLPAEAVGYLGIEGIKNAIAVASACLWHRGHQDLAALVSAKLEKNMSHPLRGGSEHRTRIPAPINEELNRLYPYARRLTARTKREDQENPALRQILSIDTSLKNRNWVLTLPREWVVELNKGEYNRRYYLPADIRIKLANLVIAMANRSF
jgi:hypothetical protein